MLISHCEISAPELLSHSQAAVRRNRRLSLLWQRFCFAKITHEWKARKAEAAAPCQKEGGANPTL